MNDIKKIVLTGGPCAGKTTALVRVIEHFSSLGFKVFTIPEVPTLFTQAGMNYLTKNQGFFYEGEKATLEIQLALEDKFLRMAEECTKPCIIVCDRGAMDISAYMSPDTWDQITRSVGTSTPDLRDRYDAVLHLVSAADGAEQYYTTANNAQRYEQMNEEGLRIARGLDKKVIHAWTGHPHLRVINNHDDFDCKMNRVLKEISNVLGLPQPIVEERKYIVELTGQFPDDSILSEITQTYLQAEPDTEIRLRKRGWGQKQVYVHTTKKKTSDNEELVVATDLRRQGDADVLTLKSRLDGLEVETNLADSRPQRTCRRARHENVVADVQLAGFNLELGNLQLRIVTDSPTAIHFAFRCLRAVTVVPLRDSLAQVVAVPKAPVEDFRQPLVPLVEPRQEDRLALFGIGQCVDGLAITTHDGIDIFRSASASLYLENTHARFEHFIDEMDGF